ALIKTYGARLSILALVSAVCFWFRHSLSSWRDDALVFSKAHPAIVVVLIGVFFEGFGILLKIFCKDFHEKHEDGIEKFEALCWMIVVIGIALEIPDASTADREAKQATERASSNELQVAKLQHEN